MTDTHATAVTVVQPGEGRNVPIPGFGAVFKLSGSTNGGEVSIVEHPFAVVGDQRARLLRRPARSRFKRLPRRGYNRPDADVAQLVEHQLPKLRVAGSNPVVRLEEAPHNGAPL